MPERSEVDAEIKAVGSHIRALRLATRLAGAKKPPSQLAMANELGVSQALVYRWESTGRITITDLFRLARFFGVPATQIIDGTPQDTSEPTDPREIDIDAMSVALVAMDAAGLNNNNELSATQHARALAFLYRLALNLKAKGITGDEAQSILTADAEKVVIWVTMDPQPPA